MQNFVIGMLISVLGIFLTALIHVYATSFFLFVEKKGVLVETLIFYMNVLSDPQSLNKKLLEEAYLEFRKQASVFRALSVTRPFGHAFIPKEEQLKNVSDMLIVFSHIMGRNISGSCEKFNETAKIKINKNIIEINKILNFDLEPPCF